MRAALATGLLMSAMASGVMASVTLDSEFRGWYAAAGTYSLDNTNYYVGRDTSMASGIHRDVFIFDLGSVSETVTEAHLKLYNPGVSAGDPHNGYSSPDASEVFQLFDVSASPSDITGAVNPLVIWDDLGFGVKYGMATVDSSSNGAWLDITLNAAGVAAINANLGGKISLGGTLSSLAPSNQTEYLFAYTFETPNNLPALELTTVPVPEPTSLSLLVVGSVLALRRSRKGS